MTDTKDLAQPPMLSHIQFDMVALQALINMFIMSAAMLAAVQFRLMLTIGAALGEEYEPHFLELYGVLFGAVFVAYAASFLLQIYQSSFTRQFRINRQFRLLLMSLALSDVVILIFMPEVSQLQLIYFSVMVVVLGIFLVLLPGRLRQNANQHISIIDNLKQILEHRYLIQIWASHRIRARYTQTFLGMLWIILLPIMESVVMAFAFSQLLGRRGQGELPWVLFLLSGRVAFIIFQKIVMNGKSALHGMSGIMQQVYFPRELIIILLATEVVIDFLFAFAGFVIIAMFYGIMPNVYYLLLPIPVILLLMMSMGIGFIVAWLSLLIRDMQQLTGVIVQLLFYLTVLFDANQVADRLRFIPLLNPISAMVEAFRDITVYGRMPDLTSLYFPGVLSVAVLYTGYVFYKVNEDRFTDYI